MLFSIPGVENLSQTTATIIALVIALVLVAFFGLILRRLTSGRLSLKSDRGRARQPRLGIVDVYDLDRQRQLILLRRDNVEHLLLVGGPNDVVVETNIVRAGGSRLPAAPIPDPATERSEAAAERSVEIPAVRPVFEPTSARTAEPAVAQLGQAEATGGGAIEPPARPSPVNVIAAPRPTERASRSVGGRPGAGEPRAEPSRPQPGGAFGGGLAAPSPSTPSPERIVDAPRPDVRTEMAKQLEEALARPTPPSRPMSRALSESRASPEPRPTPARTLDMPRATPVAQPGRTDPLIRKPEPEPETLPAIPPAPDVPTPPEPEPAPTQQVEPEPPPEPAREPDTSPEPAQPDAASPIEIEPEPEIEAVAPAEPVRDEEPAATVEPPEPPAPPPDVPMTAEPEAPAPETDEEEVAVQVQPPAASSGSTAPTFPPPLPPRNDPFSIEDIEAEFARLLGRPIEKRDDRG